MEKAVLEQVESFAVNREAAKNETIFDYGSGDEYPEQLYAYNGIATGVNGFESVTPAHLDQFHEQGYLVVNNAFTPGEVQDALDGLFALIAGQNPDYHGLMFEKKAKGLNVKALPPEEKQDYVRKFMWFVEYETRLKAMAEHPKLLKLVQQMIGDTPELHQDMALLKPPRIGREKPWHQDHAYFDYPLGTPIVGAWVALDEATLENGCMQVLPGLHREGPRLHFRRRDWQICDREIMGRRSVAVPLKPGGLLLFDGLLPHGTPHNSSAQRRRAVQFHYAPKNVPSITQEERLKVFGSEGKGVTC